MTHYSALFLNFCMFREHFFLFIMYTACPPFPSSLLEVVLVLSGMVLIFFLVACLGLRFGFVLKRVLITRCFSYG